MCCAELAKSSITWLIAGKTKGLHDGIGRCLPAQVELADACVEAFDSCSRLRLDDRENVELIAAATATAIAQVWMVMRSDAGSVGSGLLAVKLRRIAVVNDKPMAAVLVHDHLSRLDQSESHQAERCFRVRLQCRTRGFNIAAVADPLVRVLTQTTVRTRL